MVAYNNVQPPNGPYYPTAQFVSTSPATYGNYVCAVPGADANAIGGVSHGAPTGKFPLIINIENIFCNAKLGFGLIRKPKGIKTIL